MNRYIILWGFIFISLIVKEFHPFTKSQMYSSFPAQSHNFYITDHQNNILPIHEYFNYSSQDLAHNFEAISNKSLSTKINESKEIDIGKKLFEILKNHSIKPLPKGKIRLYRMNNYIENEEIVHLKSVIFTYDNI